MPSFPVEHIEQLLKEAFRKAEIEPDASGDFRHREYQLLADAMAQHPDDFPISDRWLYDNVRVEINRVKDGDKKGVSLKMDLVDCLAQYAGHKSYSTYRKEISKTEGTGTRENQIISRLSRLVWLLPLVAVLLFFRLLFPCPDSSVYVFFRLLSAVTIAGGLLGMFAPLILNKWRKLPVGLAIAGAAILGYALEAPQWIVSEACLSKCDQYVEHGDLMALGAVFCTEPAGPTLEFVKAEVDKRIHELEQKVDAEHQILLFQNRGKEVLLDTLLDYFQRYEALPGKYSNDYHFRDGRSTEKGKTKLTQLKVDLSTPGPFYGHGLQEFQPYLFIDNLRFDSTHFNCSYAIRSMEEPSSCIESLERSGHCTWTAKVSYTSHVRYLWVQMKFPDKEGKKWRRFTFTGLRPTEEFIFQYDDIKKTWQRTEKLSL